LHLFIIKITIVCKHYPEFCAFCVMKLPWDSIHCNPCSSSSVLSTLQTTPLYRSKDREKEGKLLYQVLATSQPCSVYSLMFIWCNSHNISLI
jgi:hypothetical protein